MVRTAYEEAIYRELERRAIEERRAMVQPGNPATVVAFRKFCISIDRFDLAGLQVPDRVQVDAWAGADCPWENPWFGTLRGVAGNVADVVPEANRVTLKPGHRFDTVFADGGFRLSTMRVALVEARGFEMPGAPATVTPSSVTTAEMETEVAKTRTESDYQVAITDEVQAMEPQTDSDV